MAKNEMGRWCRGLCLNQMVKWLGTNGGVIGRYYVGYDGVLDKTSSRNPHTPAALRGTKVIMRFICQKEEFMKC